MNILITGAASRLGRAVAEALEGHALRLMDESPVEAPGGGDATGDSLPDQGAIEGSLLDQDAVWRAVRGMDAVVHTGEPPQKLPESDTEREKHLLELATRGTHQLFKAGVEAGVKRFVYGGTLDLFRPYPDDVYISELWKPLPEPDMPAMSRYLGEHTAREFARDHMVTVTGLRLGRLVCEQEVAGQAPDLLWLDYRDAAQAFRLALERDASDQVWWTSRYAMYHVCADLDNPKYLINQARDLGYAPVHNFAANWRD